MSLLLEIRIHIHIALLRINDWLQIFNLTNWSIFVNMSKYTKILYCIFFYLDWKQNILTIWMLVVERMLIKNRLIARIVKKIFENILEKIIRHLVKLFKIWFPLKLNQFQNENCQEKYILLLIKPLLFI